jgi:hypothetical protein
MAHNCDDLEVTLEGESLVVRHEDKVAAARTAYDYADKHALSISDQRPNMIRRKDGRLYFVFILNKARSTCGVDKVEKPQS